MFKNFDPRALGVAGRQSEIIELAMTFGFRGLELDGGDFGKRVEMRGLDYTRRFLDSARGTDPEHVKLQVGCFKLPTRWQGEEKAFQDDLAKLPQLAEWMASTNATKCTTAVPTQHDSLPYHEYFEQSSKRLNQVAEILGQHNLRLGLSFDATKAARADAKIEFIYEAEKLLVMVQTIGAENIGLVLDTWHWHVGGGTVDMIRNLPASKIVAVRVAEVTPGVAKDALTENDRILPSVGGACKIEAYISALAALGYQGPITPYKSPKHMFGETREKIVLAATKALDSLWLAAGLSRPPRSDYLRLIEDGPSYGRGEDDSADDEDEGDDDSDDDNDSGDSGSGAEAKKEAVASS